MSHDQQDKSEPVDDSGTAPSSAEKEKSPRRHYRRYLLLAGALVVFLAVGITAVVVDMGGDYDNSALDGLCGRLDTTPMRTADPLATRTFADPVSRTDNYFRDGGRAQYCERSYAGEDGQPLLSELRVAAAVYPNRRGAALAYNQTERGDIGSQDSAAGSSDYEGPLLLNEIPGVRSGRIRAAAGIDAPQAFCATTDTATIMEQYIQSGYVIVARDSNLLVEVYVQLTGQRMDLARRRWAAATIMHQVLPLLRI